MSDAKEKMAPFLREVSNWDWDKFVRAENDKGYSTNDSIIFALVRAITMEKMDAIKIALNRLDGKIATPIKVVYPKIFYTYPNAKYIEGKTEEESYSITEQKSYSGKITDETPDYTPPKQEAVEGEIVELDTPDWHDETDYNDLPSMTLRQTLSKMADYPRDTPETVLGYAQLIEEHFRGQPTQLPIRENIPKVKSVIAAHLLKMAQKRDINAFYEVFDQIDGKLVETIQHVDGDIQIPIYSLTAPVGAYLNAQGVLQLEATDVQNHWTDKLKGLRNG